MSLPFGLFSLVSHGWVISLHKVKLTRLSWHFNDFEWTEMSNSHEPSKFKQLSSLFIFKHLSNWYTHIQIKSSNVWTFSSTLTLFFSFEDKNYFVDFSLIVLVFPNKTNYWIHLMGPTEKMCDNKSFIEWQSLVIIDQTLLSSDLTERQTDRQRVHLIYLKKRTIIDDNSNGHTSLVPC